MKRATRVKLNTELEDLETFETLSPAVTDEDLLYRLGLGDRYAEEEARYLDEEDVT
jgi:hypothetical protein